jgi:putative transposase
VTSSAAERRRRIEPEHPAIPVARQCELLGVSRSSYYYRPASPAPEALSEAVSRRLDELFTAYPFYGVRRLTAALRREGHPVNPKRVRRLMRQQGLAAVYPHRRLSQSAPAHRVYPYLLRDLAIERPDQVWATDITYVRLRHGFVYLVAILDWYSRYVVDWAVSTSLEAEFCVTALARCLAAGRPEIFNSDQGCQFTSAAFTGVLQAAGVAISMDGRGRVYDNIFVERLWRSVKYEAVYLHDYETVPEAERGLAEYFDFYNHRRLHQALGYRPPVEVYGRNRFAI